MTDFSNRSKWAGAGHRRGQACRCPRVQMDVRTSGGTRRCGPSPGSAPPPSASGRAAVGTPRAEATVIAMAITVASCRERLRVSVTAPARNSRPPWMR
jgi:hypothetical protein